MQPVLVLQFMQDDGPGYLGTWLQRNGVDGVVLSAASGHTFPKRIDDYRALAVLGGAMSANDDLPYLRDAEQLIQHCMEAGVPVLGHCLGGQLMARVLGARVGASPAPEIGWHRMDVLDSPSARAWFGSVSAPEVFHWHYEAFDLPAGAVALGTSDACPIQAFSIGPHLGMQFHVEIDEQKIDDWLRVLGDSYANAQRDHATAQSPDTIRRKTPLRLSSQQALADRIYSRWLGCA
jgi:GMP synthase-like glutamine amidotransferase